MCIACRSVGEVSSVSTCEVDVSSLWQETAYQLLLIGITMKNTGVAFDKAMKTWKEETEDHCGKTICISYLLFIMQNDKKMFYRHE